MIDLREYARLLGYPEGRTLEGDVLERAKESISWYERFGRPRVYIRGSVAAFTAGDEIDVEVKKRWRAERVDEAYFLDRLGAAVVETLASAYPHESPGTQGRDLSEQFEIMEALGPDAPVRMLPSGMLEPVSSLLAVLTERSTSCPDCDFRCAFRRVS